MPELRPEPPFSDWHAAAGDDPDARAALGDFHAEYSADAPNAKTLEQHAARVRAMPSLAATFERWWLDPHTQAFLAELGATGI